jgi:hypothetical protein
MWPKQIKTLDSTSNSESPKHPIELLQHPPAPESSLSSPGEQSHSPQTPGKPWVWRADILFSRICLLSRGTISTKWCMWHPSKWFTKTQSYLTEPVPPPLENWPSFPSRANYSDPPSSNEEPPGKNWSLGETPSQVHKPANHCGIILIAVYSSSANATGATSESWRLHAGQFRAHISISFFFYLFIVLWPILHDQFTPVIFSKRRQKQYKK